MFYLLITAVLVALATVLGYTASTSSSRPSTITTTTVTITATDTATKTTAETSFSTVTSTVTSVKTQNYTITSTTTTTTTATTVSFRTGTSWNPKVSCTPIIVRISDITANATGETSYLNSIFNPGITVPSDAPRGTLARRWLTGGAATPQGWIAPGPPCTITNSKGQVIGVFVEIDGVKREKIVTEDYNSSYNSINGGGLMPGGISRPDSTFNIYDPAFVPDKNQICLNSADTTCYGRIHIEIDRDWKAAGYCGTGTACDNMALEQQTKQYDTLIDVQGFVYWDPGHVNLQVHSFNGWELHPVTAWRVHPLS